MKLVVVAALVTIIAFVGSRISFARIRLPLGVENLFLTGSEYPGRPAIGAGRAGYPGRDDPRGAIPLHGLGALLDRHALRGAVGV